MVTRLDIARARARVSLSDISGKELSDEVHRVAAMNLSDAPPLRKRNKKNNIERVLRGNGITDRPEEYDSDIHSWRCSHPEIYGRCTCFQDLINDLVEATK